MLAGEQHKWSNTIKEGFSASQPTHVTEEVFFKNKKNIYSKRDTFVRLWGLRLFQILSSGEQWVVSPVG